MFNKLYHAKWESDFGHAKVNHAAAVIARSPKQAANKVKAFYNLEAGKAVSVAERGETYLHTSVVNAVPGLAIAKESK